MAITNAEAIQKLYVAYFNRPADYYGLQFWDKVVTDAKGDTSAVAAAFASSQEYKDTYAGMDLRNTINTIYKNLFGHSADLAGLDFWTNAVNTGAMTMSNAVTAIASGAQNADLVAYNSKVSAATAFTNALNTTDEILGYNGTAANNAAKSFIASVTDAASLEAAIAPAALDATVGNVTGQSSAGQTFDLTASKDTITGTAQNDTINIDIVDPKTGTSGATLQGSDAIDGGAGIDTVNIINSATVTNTIAGTFKNVEIINIDNSGAAAAVAVDASKFGTSVQTLNQIGKAGNVTNLGGNAAAVFTNIEAATTGVGTLSVQAAAAAAHVTLANVKGTATTNVVSLNVTGEALNSVTVDGTLAQKTENSTASTLALGVAVGTDANGVGLSTLTVNSAVATTLSVANSGSGKGVTTVDASASTGAIAFDATGLTALSTIKTGAGKDNVTINTATAVDNADTTVNEAVNASLSTGAGNDTIVVTTTGSGKTTVDAGAGNDTITLTTISTGGVSVIAGAGDDKVDISAVTLTTKDSINGGDGADTLTIGGKATYAAADYLLLDAVTTGFETLNFKTGAAAGGTEAIDAAQLSKFTTLQFSDSGIVENVAAAQSLTLSKSTGVTTLTASAAGFDDSDATSIVYGGTLNVTSTETNGTAAGADAALTLNAATANVKINTSATAFAGVADMIEGYLQNVNVALSSTKTVDASAVATGEESLAGVTINAVDVIGLKSVVVTGAGTATINAGTAATGTLTTIDVSGMTAMANLNANGDQVNTATATSTSYGYQNLSTTTITANGNIVEMIKLGGAQDTVNVGSSTFAKMDTITGFELVASAADKTVVSAVKSDVLNTGAAAGTTFHAITVTSTTLSGALLEAGSAQSSAGTDWNAVTFSVGGDTYVYMDKGTAGLDNSDFLVKLTGAYDTALLATAVSVAAPIVP